MGIRSTIRRHPWRWSSVGLVLAASLAFGLFWFAPWALFIDKHVNEPLPTSAAAADIPVPSEVPTPLTSPGSPQPFKPSPSGPRVLARGSFRSLEHGSSGTALLLRLTDRSTYLRFDDLNTSNGPDLRVWLTEQPVSDDWHVWDDGAYLDLGGLKGNVGDQNYLLPANIDLSRWKTAVVWCRRFRVGFAVAPLTGV